MNRVEIAKQARGLTVTLRRPEKGNAFDAEMSGAIANAFTAANRDASLHWILIEGEGRHFCTGADLAWMAHGGQLTPAENDTDAMVLATMYTAIAECEVPVLARAHGSVRGGGVGLLSGSDVVATVEGATFALPELGLGLIPGVLTPLLVEKIGRAAFLDLTLSGREISAARSLELGLSSHVGTDTEISNFLSALRQRLEECDVSALRALKRSLPRHVGVSRETFTALARETSSLRGSVSVQQRLETKLKP